MNFRTALLTFSIALPTILFALVGKKVEAQEAFPADKPPEQLKIASWNLEWFFDDREGDNFSDLAKQQNPPDQEAWLWKRDSIAEAIAKLDPSIIALQEVEGRSVMLELIKRIKDAHGTSYRLAFSEGFDGSTEQDVAILFKDGCTSYGRREQNGAMFASRQFYNLSKHLFVNFAWKKEESIDELHLFTFHLRATPESADLRNKQCKLAHQMIAEELKHGENWILLGDTNVESKYGTPMKPDDGIESLTGADTPSLDDDLIDLHGILDEPSRKTHLILDKQFDRMLISRSMQEDDPSRGDWSLEKFEVFAASTIRGQGIDLDHLESRYTAAIEERDLSDHFPIMATFVWK